MSVRAEFDSWLIEYKKLRNKAGMDRELSAAEINIAALAYERGFVYCATEKNIQIAEQAIIIKDLLDMHDSLCKEINYCTSCLTAETISKMNSAPLKARRFLDIFLSGEVEL